MNKLNLILSISLVAIFTCKGQHREHILISETDSLELYVNDEGSNELYYLQVIPATKIKDALDIFPSGRETMDDLIKQIDLPQIAYKNRIVTIMPSTNWGTENRAPEIQFLDKTHNIRARNYFSINHQVIRAGLAPART